MTYVENGVKFTDQYGDIDERFYCSIESALDELAALLRGEARELYPKFCGRLASVEQLTDGIGWGFHDFIADVVGRLEEEFAEPVATKPGQVMSVAATTEMAAAAKLRWENIKAAKTAKLK